MTSLIFPRCKAEALLARTPNTTNQNETPSPADIKRLLDVFRQAAQCAPGLPFLVKLGRADPFEPSFLPDDLRFLHFIHAEIAKPHGMHCALVFSTSPSLQKLLSFSLAISSGLTPLVGGMRCSESSPPGTEDNTDEAR